MMIGYLYLYKYNPNIDWWKSQWKFTRCLDTCVSKAYKIRDVEAGTNELYLELDISGSSLLDDIGDEDPSNHILSWADMTDPGSYQQAMMIAAILNHRDQYGDYHKWPLTDLWVDDLIIKRLKKVKFRQ